MPTCLLPLLLLALSSPQAAEPERETPPTAVQQEAVRSAVRAGRIVPLQQVVADALRRYPGVLLEVELDDDGDEYEIEILGPDGVVMELEYDARTGRLKKMEVDR